jgi:LPS-assembly lipoprotein
MSWSRRQVLVAAAALAGCGFTPVYGPGGAGRALQGAVRVETPRNDSDGFVLAREMEDRLGVPVAERYVLTLSVDTEEERVVITASQDTNRYLVLGRARYSLLDVATGAVAATGRADAFSSYAATGTTVATRAAERDAHLRLMVILADKIMSQLIATAPGTTQ